jgi:hypothetical protein
MIGSVSYVNARVLVHFHVHFQLKYENVSLRVITQQLMSCITCNLSQPFKYNLLLHVVEQN